jgi:hypothetical protein
MPRWIILQLWIRYNVDWVGPEGLCSNSHQSYLDQLAKDFNKTLLKLIERGIKKLDRSPQVCTDFHTTLTDFLQPNDHNISLLKLMTVLYISLKDRQGLHH